MAEYPKSVFIPFISRNSMEDILMAFYALAFTKTTSPEVSIINKDPVLNRDGYILPQDAFALTLRGDTQISFEDFRKTYLYHKSGITAVTALDKADRRRVSVLLMPEDSYRDAGIDVNPIVTFYDRETEAQLSAFFRMWDEKYCELKEKI